MFKRICSYCILALSLLTLGACTRVQTDVTRFHTMPSTGAGATFVMLPYKDQQGSLEWRQYGSLVSQQLAVRGFRQVPSLPADFAVFIAYGIDDGKTTVTSAPIWGQTGGGTSFSSGSLSGNYGTTPYSGTYTGTTYTAPTYGVTGYVPVKETTYTRVFLMDMVDAKQSTAQNVVKRYEAKARSAGGNNNLNQVAPYMVEAIFKNFPGRSGETERVVVQVK